MQIMQVTTAIKIELLIHNLVWKFPVFIEKAVIQMFYWIEYIQ